MVVTTRSRKAHGHTRDHVDSSASNAVVTKALTKTSQKSLVVTPDVESSTRSRYFSRATQGPTALLAAFRDEDTGDNEQDDGIASENQKLVESVPSGDLQTDRDGSTTKEAKRKSTKRCRSTEPNTSGGMQSLESSEDSAIPPSQVETLPKTTRQRRRRSTSSATSSSSAAAVDTERESSPAPKEANKRTRKKATKKTEEEVKPRDPPTDWGKIYSLVEELRADKTAPVDTDGGHALPERNHGEVVFRFQLLIALMLSSQTKDAVVGDTMRALQKYGLTVENLHQTSPEELDQMIRSVGFHNNKTKYIKQACEIILQDYGGDIPPSAEELMKLPGVGPKMAYIVEAEAFGVARGIGVDTHMHRMFNDLGWVTNTKTPEKSRVELESWLPRELWRSVNVLWVGFGQETQQQKEKILRKALDCSRPAEALALVQKVGRFDLLKEAKKMGLEEKMKLVLEERGVKEESSCAQATIDTDGSAEDKPKAKEGDEDMDDESNRQ